jgi:hypothetical protein
VTVKNDSNYAVEYSVRDEENAGERESFYTNYSVILRSDAKD